MDQQVSSDSYLLTKRFPMPWSDGTKDAVALSQSHGLILVSLYTMMMKAILTQFWAAIVIIGVGMYLRKYDHPDDLNSDSTATTAGIWNVKSSPRAVALLTLQQLCKMRKSPQRWYPFLWMVLAAMIVAASLVVPILKTHSLQIGTQAPVNGSAIFVPPLADNYTTPLLLAQIYSLIVPVALRAVALMSTIPAHTVFFDSVSRGTGNSSMVSLTYSYGITGTDFGLQRTPDLQFNVTGSCFTDYSWYTGPQDSGNIQTDGYKAYNDSSQIETITSEAQGPPYVKQVIAPISDDSASNTSFGLIVTSFGRYSFTPSNDPWYLTEHSGSNPVDYAYTISRGRPGLSCWENATWTYQGSTSATESLNSLTHGDLSSPLTQTFQQYLFQPMVLTLSGLLGRSALASSTLTVSQALNAELCSIENDISRLVNIAYLMTRNILSDSTLISPLGRDNITNLVRSADQQTVLPGADEFVVSGPDIMTLSVRDLILIPTLLGGVVFLVIIFANLPGRWRLTNDLNAVKLQKLKRKAKHQNAASESKSHEKELEVRRDEESLTTKDAIDVQ